MNLLCCCSMKIYKISKSYYKVREERLLLILPKGLKLLYLDGDIGPYRIGGHNHYLGCIRKSDNDSDIETIKKINKETPLKFFDFGDLLLFVIDNIKFISDSPEFYTPEEFNSEFEIDKYFIEVIAEKEGNFGKDKNGDIQIPEESLVEETCNISKINKILGPYSVEVSSVIDYSDNIYDINTSIVSLDQLLSKGLNKQTTKVVYKGDDSKYREMVEKVLNKISYVK